MTTDILFTHLFYYVWFKGGLAQGRVGGLGFACGQIGKRSISFMSSPYHIHGHKTTISLDAQRSLQKNFTTIEMTICYR